jgi:hypothetical protein
MRKFAKLSRGLLAALKALHVLIPSAGASK